MPSTNLSIKSTGQSIKSSRNEADISTGGTVIAFPNAPIAPQRTAEQPAPTVVNKSLPAGAFVRGEESRY